MSADERVKLGIAIGAICAVLVLFLVVVRARKPTKEKKSD